MRVLPKFISILWVLLAACGAALQVPPVNPRQTGATHALTRVDLGTTGTVLSALTGRVANLEITRQDAACPIISLRGQRSIIGNNAPTLYVNGTRMLDTCILDQIPVREVERIEIYSIAAPKLGYLAGANGSIVVFLR
jgi:hypothetical protein